MGLFEGRVVRVTGAGRGIGRAVVLAEQGAAVALVSRTQNEVERAAEEIRARGGTALVLPLDVSNWDRVNWTAQQIEAALGPLHILTNNAGVLEPLGKLWETDPEQAKRLFEVNLAGAYYGLRAVLPGMVQRGHGHARSIATRPPAVLRRSKRSRHGAAAGSPGARRGVVVFAAL